MPREASGVVRAGKKKVWLKYNNNTECGVPFWTETTLPDFRLHTRILFAAAETKTL